MQVVFSLLAILLSFDMVAGEKERGTLKAVLANPVPRDSILLGKLIGGFFVLFLVFLIGALLLFLMLVLFDSRFLAAPSLGPMLVIFGVSVLFLAGFYTLGLMVSTFCHSTRTAIVVLLIVWVLLLLVIPKAGELTLPPLKVGGFFLQPEPPATAKAKAGLTLSPEANTASPAANTF